MSTSGSDDISPKLDDGLKGGGLDDRVESAGPPLAPADVPVESHALRESAEGSPDSFHEPTPTEQPPLVAPVSGHADANENNFRPRGKLIAGIVIGVGLVLAALAYFFVPFRSEKAVTASRTEQPAAPIRSEPAPPVPAPAPAPQPRASIPESAPTSASPSAPVQAPTAASPERSAPSPELPAPIRPAQPATPPVETPAQVAPAPAAPTPVAPAPPAGTGAALRPPAAVPQGRQILFLQRPGVNIRSTPSSSANVVGSAPQGTRFEVTNRNGEWIQVESGRFKGWINARFLGPNPP
jgi:cytoskeletal protein RodZ